MRKALVILIAAVSAYFQVAYAQQSGGEMIVGSVYSKVDGTLIGVNIREVDATNRIVSGTLTDINGNFSLKIKNPANKLQITYVGYKSTILPIGTKRKFSIQLEDASKTIDVVEIKGKKLVSTGAMSIPERENSMAMQTLKADFESLSVASIDEALQGQIAGLDVISNSGDLGSGSTMRLRGTASINANVTPLIVVNDLIFDAPSSDQFDFVNANNESFANLLSINVDDIESINVMKDGASSAQWGARGANGVISIRTKKGMRGKPRLTYTYRLSGKTQREGMKMLNGDQYTMFLKEAYFNPKQSDKTSDIREFNYIHNDAVFPDWRMYDNNTDWVSAVKTTGIVNDHYLTLKGGGEKATFYISGGYYTETGSIIGQKLDRYTSRMDLNYNVSDRILFQSEMSVSYTDENKNYEKILDVAYKKMPNMAIYREYENGVPSSDYYYMPQNNQINPALNDQRKLSNPVAVANLAKNNVKSYRLIPTFRLQYDILPREDGQMLQVKGLVSFDISNNTTYAFLPRELSTQPWTDGNMNKTDYGNSKSNSTTARFEMQWMPKFANPDHSLSTYASAEIRTGTSAAQSEASYGLPEGVTSPTAGSYISGMSSSTGYWAGMSSTFVSHYSYKSKYNVDFTIRREGNSKFGPKRKFGTFGGLAVRWNVVDELFMAPTSKWLSMLSFRASFAVTGNAPKDEYLHYSRYGLWGTYLGEGTVRPLSIPLNDLRWEKVQDKNAGIDLGFLKDRFEVHFNLYDKTTKDLLTKDVSIPTTSGYSSYTWQNGGSVNNRGWELYLNANKFVKAGKFSIDCNLNFSNNRNLVLDLNDIILKQYNGDYDFDNGTYMSRLQLNNSLGSIYGFKYKGVYEYSLDNPRLIESNYSLGTAPVARNAAGKIIYDSEGKPVPMYFAYGTSRQLAFQGGDAIYEDINHDGNINQLDIVYLGNSNPKFNGGFGIKFNYDRFSVNIYSVFRYGNKVINAARMEAENMVDNSNQSRTINWRWRKDGDKTWYPRAMNGNDNSRNFLGSDRYMEDGSFWRINQLSINYSFPGKLLSKLSINSASFYFTLYNLFCFTKYSGVDPEVGYGSWGVSKDGNQTPRAKSFTSGLTLQF
ncbi:MAG TPA: SusC/RagA family TonB-linked outer membrane protein [Paludibacter sp.]|nr:SusC/RagA family TonB-linked outer membrane protein [Paludibacter sp.]